MESKQMKIFKKFMKDIRLTTLKRKWKKRIKKAGLLENRKIFTNNRINERLAQGGLTNVEREITIDGEQKELITKYDPMISELTETQELVKNAYENKEEAIKLAIANDQMKQKKIEYLVEIIRRQDRIINCYNENLKKLIKERQKKWTK